MTSPADDQLDKLERELQRVQSAVTALTHDHGGGTFTMTAAHLGIVSLQSDVQALAEIARRPAPVGAVRSPAGASAGRRAAKAQLATALQKGARSESLVIRKSSDLALRSIRRMRSRSSNYTRLTPAVGARGTNSAQQIESPRDAVTRLAERNDVVIVIPVFNAAAALDRCLRSVLAHTRPPHRVLLMDDGSTDRAIEPLLDRAARHSHVQVIRSAVNRGFTATVNAAFAITGEDVVLLNSDTEVGPGWLEGLLVAAHSSDHVATATPLSDNAGAFSAPLVGEENPLPDGLDTTAAARLVRRGSSRTYPRVPTGHGFCMYIRRRALEQVGPFDVTNFPRGYGEENDFCLRATAAGFEHVLDDATYVRHERSASFGPEKEELLRAGRARLDVLHPGYTRAVRGFLADPLVHEARAAAGRSLAAPPGPVLPRALFVLHDGTGGTPATNLDLMRAVADRFDCYTLTASSDRLLLSRVVDGELLPQREIALDQPWRVTHVARGDYRREVSALLLDLGFELVHIRHLMGHTLELPALCKALGIPVVLSFHDFYLSCPTVHLVDNNDRFCGGRCSAGPGACRLSTRSMREVPPLKHEWVHEWRRAVGEAFRHVDIFVTTSQAARDVMTRSHPPLLRRDFRVIPHGRDLPPGIDACAPVSPHQPVRVLFTGNVGAHKGAALIRQVAELDGGQRLDLHFLGKTSPELYDIGTHHGAYERDDFPALVKQIAPSFIGVLAIWAETYSHTLTESWSVGVPVLASDIGVLRERVQATGAGWCIHPYDAQAAYEQILLAASDSVEHQRRREAARSASGRTIAEMAEDYLEIYDALLAGRVW